MVGVEKLRGARLAKHVLAHRGMLAGVPPQLVDPVRVGQEPDVHHRVGVHRQPVLVPERLHGDAGVRDGLAAEGPSMLSRSAGTDSVEVSMIRSAVARTGASMARSAAMPSASVWLPCSGWLRRFCS